MDALHEIPLIISIRKYLVCSAHFEYNHHFEVNEIETKRVQENGSVTRNAVLNVDYFSKHFAWKLKMYYQRESLISLYNAKKYSAFVKTERP